MSKVKQVLLAVGIAIIFALFVGYGIATFYKSPKYEDYCKGKEYPRPYIETEPNIKNTNCGYVKPDEKLVVECNEKKGDIMANYTDKGCIESYYCEMCNKEYRDKQEIYDRNVFIITLILGLAAIIVGGIVLTITSVSSGLMGGGMLTVIYGTIRYWGFMPDVVRFIELGIVLIVLIWIGYKKIRK